jgi:hypothetical protein
LQGVWDAAGSGAGLGMLTYRNIPLDQPQGVAAVGIDYCGSATNNTQWVPELWYGGDAGACAKHDECYRGLGTSGWTRAQCDLQFLRDMAFDCLRWSGPFLPVCALVAAPFYYAAVGLLGGTVLVNAMPQ